MKKRSCLLLTGLLLNSMMVFSQTTDEVKIWEDTIVLPTYKIHEPDKNPMFFLRNSYQGASAAVYPYPLINNLSNDKQNISYKALFLENEYIKLCVLPEIGGKLFYATDKTDDYEIFYRQHVIKPSNIGMLGAWISGGIEWCVFHHHRASTFLPMDYRLSENDDGSKTIWIGEIEPRQRMKWTVGITLFPGRSYIRTDLRMYNRTEIPNSILYWANVAVHAGEDYQVFFPPSVDFGMYHAKNSFAHWPVTREAYHGLDYYENNIDASWWKNHPTPISFFAYDLKDDFLAGYDHAKDAGTIQVADHNVVKGAKLWQWGPGPSGANYDTVVLTDHDGPYIELMSGGFSDNQPDYSWIMPYETKHVTQYWYPLRKLKGVKSANTLAAINLIKQDDDQVFIGINTTAFCPDSRVKLTIGGKPYFSEQANIGPSKPYVHMVKVPALTGYHDLKLTVSNKSGEEMISYSPQRKDQDKKLPETVQSPPPPSEIATNEELYLTGLRIKQFHNARLDAMDYFMEALARDSFDVRCNVQAGLDMKSRGNYQQAACYFRKAIARLTKDYTRPRDCESLYHLGVTLKTLGKYDDAYDTLYRASWDQHFYAPAHYQMAGISCSKKDFEKALFHVNRSLSANSLNIEALGLKAAILRHTGDLSAAKQVTVILLKTDPLSHWGHFESYLNSYDNGSKTETREKFVALLRDQPQSYIELATDYMNNGFNEDAEKLLLLASKSETSSLHNYPMIYYYLGYLKDREGKMDEAASLFTRAASLSSDYCFPFRFESLRVLDAAIARNANDYKALYYQGNILYDHRPEDAIHKWEQVISINPGFAIAHRNLGWGYQHCRNDIAQAINEYETAIELNPQDARYYYELDKLYEENNTSPEKRLAVLEKNHSSLAKREDALIREIMVLVLNSRYDLAIDYLNNYFFHIQEGSRDLHDMHVDAYLLRGISRMKSGRYEEALDDFLKADTYPANHQIGRDPDYTRNCQIYYYTGLAYEKSGEKDSAESFYRKAFEQKIRSSVYLYYQALAYEKLGNKKTAGELYNQLVETGQEYLTKMDEVDFFAKFGRGQSMREREATGHYMIGLGMLGNGSRKEAIGHLEKTIELDKSRKWAKVHMEKL